MIQYADVLPTLIQAAGAVPPEDEIDGSQKWWGVARCVVRRRAVGRVSGGEDGGGGVSG